MPVRTGFYYDIGAKGTFHVGDDSAVSDPSYADDSRGEDVWITADKIPLVSRTLVLK